MSQPLPSTPVAGEVPDCWRGFFDDASVLPGVNRPLADALGAHESRRGQWWGPLVGSLVVPDDRLAQVDPAEHADLPVTVLATSGAGAVVGIAHVAARRGLSTAGVWVTLRDPDDLTTNARRVVAAVDAARSEGLAEEVPVTVELPSTPAEGGWLRAADELAAAELRLGLRTLGGEAGPTPDAATFAGWIDAALDRETPFCCPAGLRHAVRYRDRETGVEHHGFLNVLLATRRAFDGAARDEVAGLLTDHYPNDLVALARQSDLAGVRRWFVSAGTTRVTGARDDLVALGLLSPPRGSAT